MTNVISAMTKIHEIFFPFLTNQGYNGADMKIRVTLVYNTLYGLNFLITAFLSMTICLTLYKICSDYQARDFLEMARYLPHVAWKVPTYSIALFSAIGISNILKQTLFKGQKTQITILYLMDLILFGIITYTLNFSYKGFFLFVCAGLFLHIQGMSVRLVILIITLACYIIFDYDLLTVRVNMVPFQEYMNFYSPNIRFYLFGIKSFLESINLILVMIFFYMFIQSKIKENKEFIQLNNRLKTNLAELKLANEKLEEAGRMKERNRLAHEIHDILGHSLTCISTGLEASIEVAKHDSKVLGNQLKRLKEVSDKGLLDIRRSVKELKSDIMDEASLIRAVQEMVGDINALGKQEVVLSIIGEVPTMQHDEELTIYRLIQESTTNSIRHGRAVRIHVVMRFHESFLILEISDNGIGCSRIVKNFGLSHMEERVNLLGGSLRFISEKNRGFRTIARIPLRRESLR